MEHLWGKTNGPCVKFRLADRGVGVETRKEGSTFSRDFLVILQSSSSEVRTVVGKLDADVGIGLFLLSLRPE